MKIFTKAAIVTGIAGIIAVGIKLLADKYKSSRQN